MAESFVCRVCGGIGANDHTCPCCFAFGKMVVPKPPPRPMPVLSVGMTDCDAMLGGGLHANTCYLLAGEPGSGKTTLLAQWLGHTGGCYLTTEESAGALRRTLRSVRQPGRAAKHVRVISEKTVAAGIESAGDATVLVVDSISGMGATRDQQVADLNLCVKYARRLQRPVIAISHVNKDGELAGYKKLEHIPDGVLMLVGEAGSTSRRLVPKKLRGQKPITVSLSRGEYGFEEGVADAIKLERPRPLVGSCFSPVFVNGSVQLVEFCALTAPGNGKTRTENVDSERVARIVSTLQSKWRHLAQPWRRLNLTVATESLQATDSQADLAIAIAILSAITQRPLPPITLAWGQVSLVGDVRSDEQWDARADLARRLPQDSVIVNPFQADSVEAAWEILYPGWTPEAPVEPEPAK